MSTFHTSGRIKNSPEAVISYVADPRNRPLFFPSLKSISDIQGDPTAEGTSWKWTFATLGMEFQGKGHCVKHVPGKLYSFKTEGGIESTITYRAEPEGDGTRLSIQVDYQVPEDAKSKLPAESRAKKMREKEAAQALENLQKILDQ